MRFWVVLCLFFFGMSDGFGTEIMSVSGKIRITSFPEVNQLFERDRVTDSASIPIAGTVIEADAYDRIRVVVTNSGAPLIVEQALTYVEDTANFNLPVSIPADLFNHTITLFGISGSDTTKEWEVHNIVAGDVIIINGQSNAQAFLTPDSVDVIEFTRSFYGWYRWDKLDKSFPGLWGARLAHMLALRHQIPIAVFNFADGARPISYFQQESLVTDTLGNNNFDRMLIRLDEAGISGAIAAFWFQGEANAWETPGEEYIASFDSLNQSWIQKLGIEEAFLYQLRFGGCGHPLPYISEAQRQIGREFDDVHIMSTTNANHDSCHFYYDQGYQDLGNRMSYIASHNLYNFPIGDDDFAPDVASVSLVGDNELIVRFEPVEVLSIIGDPSGEFIIVETGEAATHVEAVDDALYLSFDGVLDTSMHLQYLSHIGSAPDWIVSSKGVGILQFYNVPIEKEIVSTVETHQENGFSIYPNPSSGIIQLELFDTSGASKIEVHHATGGLVYQAAGLSDRETLDLSFLPQGIYYLSITQAGHRSIEKWVKL